MRLFSIEVGILGGLPAPDALGRQLLAPQEPADPLIGHRGQQLRPRQYFANSRTDHAQNGNPRSAGLDSATTTNSLRCAALGMGGWPFGFGICSKVADSLVLKRWTQSYVTVKWQPTGSPASRTPCPLRTSSITR